MNTWANKQGTLGERMVAFMKNEMANNVGEDKPKSYTSPRIREYFSICTRLVGGRETPIGIHVGNWCSSSISYALHQCINTEPKPHGYRVGVVEVIADLKANGLYRTIKEVKNGTYKLKVGDPVFFDRSDPTKPETAWFRHIGLVTSVSDKSFTHISGNSSGKIREGTSLYTQANLLGFGDYPPNKMSKKETETLPSNIGTIVDNELKEGDDYYFAGDDFFDIYKKL